MATGGASHIAGTVGLNLLSAPLLWLAVGAAATIAAPRLVRVRRHGWRAWSDRFAEFGFGAFTLAIGLAVIGIGVTAVGTAPARFAAAGLITLAWLATGLLLVTVGVPALSSRRHGAAVDGSWFLAPAALLADAICTTGLAPGLPHPVQHAMVWLAVAGCGLGFLGYWMTVALAAVHLTRVGTVAGNRVSWWISAGCGGLAAAALGHLQLTAAAPDPGHWLTWAALAVWITGSLLLIPVLIGSARHLTRRRRTPRRPCWPPTFSTAVYALGTDAIGGMTHLPAVVAAGRIAGFAAVVLWLVTAVVFVAELAGRRAERAAAGPVTSGR